MNTTTKSLLASLAVLTAGLAIAGFLMFAFVQDAEAHDTGPHGVGSKLEVAINDEGRVVVRGAEVTDVSGDTIHARTEWGEAMLSWTVRTDADTDFVTKGGSGSALDEVSVGDYVSFSGALRESESSFTVDADAVRNWSLGDDRPAVRADAKNRWDAWKKIPIFSWFKGKGDSR